MSTIGEILNAFSGVLGELEGVQVYDHVPESPNVPALIVYCERWPYNRTEDATFVILCLAGTTETQGAQAQLMDWLSDDGDTSICALIDADNTLGDVCDVLPLEVRNWGISPAQDGRPRYLQAEIVCNVFR